MEFRFVDLIRMFGSLIALSQSLLAERVEDIQDTKLVALGEGATRKPPPDCRSVR
jgi:hypothetical protein